MIIVVLSGGTGSQLYQYAAALNIANSKKDFIVIDAAWYHMSKEVKDDRHLNFNKLVSAKYKIIIKSLYISRILRSTLFFISFFSFGFFQYQKIYIKNPFKFEKFPEASNYFINGYMNNMKYYENSYKDILKKIIISKKKTTKVKIAIHVRKGKDIFNTIVDFCNKNYYLSAVEKIIKIKKINIKNLEIFIFSDNSDWCKKNLIFKKIKTKFIFGNDSTAIIDLKKMMQCDHIVIPNSSYSWWAGAYIDYCRKGIVICPNLWWDRISVKKLNIYPASWFILNTKVKENKNPQYPV